MLSSTNIWYTHGGGGQSGSPIGWMFDVCFWRVRDIGFASPTNILHISRLWPMELGRRSKAIFAHASKTNAFWGNTSSTLTVACISYPGPTNFIFCEKSNLAALALSRQSLAILRMLLLLLRWQNRPLWSMAKLHSAQGFCGFWGGEGERRGQRTLFWGLSW